MIAKLYAQQAPMADAAALTHAKNYTQAKQLL